MVDCGASEGFFSIQHIDLIKKLYLFEPDEQWIEPLTATYSKWNDKVEIVTKFLSDKTDEVSVSLDDYFRDKECPSLIKMDVEGFEGKILDGGHNTLSSSQLKKVLACVYHHADDEKTLSQKLETYCFEISLSEGYTLLSLDIIDGKFQPPFLRHCVIRARK